MEHLHTFLILALDGSGQSLTFELVYSWGKRPSIHFTEGWVGLKVSLDMVVTGKIPAHFGN